MIPAQVNRTATLVALALSLACAPAGGSRQNGESTTVTRADTAAVAPRPAPTDSNITRADLARIQGSPSAPLWVIEVSDFQCPYCKQWHDQTYNAFVDQFVKTGKVRLAYVNFPLQSHVHAWPAAEAAMCAGAQGKFWPMHDALFTTQTKWEALPSPAPVFDSLAQASGVEMRRWRDCVASGKMKSLIAADQDRAQRAGANATPSFMIGDKILAGAQPIEDLRRIIDSALVKNKSTTP
ncbi:MAG TPA: thioredoxin domain-containing protein [Gemmatimonadaceae bacterium]|nr:thioredoxin domain-containing protein [Gemmatimonadaceae bacterium]